MWINWSGLCLGEPAEWNEVGRCFPQNPQMSAEWIEVGRCFPQNPQMCAEWIEVGIGFPQNE